MKKLFLKKVLTLFAIFVLVFAVCGLYASAETVETCEASNLNSSTEDVDSLDSASLLSHEHIGVVVPTNYSTYDTAKIMVVIRHDVSSALVVCDSVMEWTLNWQITDPYGTTLYSGTRNDGGAPLTIRQTCAEWFTTELQNAFGGYFKCQLVATIDGLTTKGSWVQIQIQRGED